MKSRLLAFHSRTVLRSTGTIRSKVQLLFGNSAHCRRQFALCKRNWSFFSRDVSVKGFECQYFHTTVTNGTSTVLLIPVYFYYKYQVRTYVPPTDKYVPIPYGTEIHNYKVVDQKNVFVQNKYRMEKHFFTT